MNTLLDNLKFHWVCGGCGADLSEDEVDCLGGHRRWEDDGKGNPIPVHCGPCESMTEDEYQKYLFRLTFYKSVVK